MTNILGVNSDIIPIGISSRKKCTPQPGIPIRNDGNSIHGKEGGGGGGLPKEMGILPSSELSVLGSAGAAAGVAAVTRSSVMCSGSLLCSQTLTEAPQQRVPTYATLRPNHT